MQNVFENQKGDDYVRPRAVRREDALSRYVREARSVKLLSEDEELYYQQQLVQTRDVYRERVIEVKRFMQCGDNEKVADDNQHEEIDDEDVLSGLYSPKKPDPLIEKLMSIIQGLENRRKISEEVLGKLTETKLLLEKYLEEKGKFDEVVYSYASFNFRLVLSLAYMKKLSGCASREDLIQEGNFGLVHGIRKYQPGWVKLATYVSWWIRTYINKAQTDTHGDIRVPYSHLGTVRLLDEAEVTEEGNGPEVSIEVKGQKQIYPLEKAEMMKWAAGFKFNRSLDASFQMDREGEHRSLMDIVEDKGSESPEEIYERQEQIQIIWKWIDDCALYDERNKNILRMRLRGMTLQKIADQVNVTRERVRQIVNNMTKSMKNDLSKR